MFGRIDLPMMAFVIAVLLIVFGPKTFGSR
jgi:Sec-independent protein translocase protein TatA